MAGTVASRVKQHLCVRTFSHGIIFQDVWIVLMHICNDLSEHLFRFFKKNRGDHIFSQPCGDVRRTEMMPVEFVLALTVQVKPLYWVFSRRSRCRWRPPCTSGSECSSRTVVLRAASQNLSHPAAAPKIEA
nr:repeat element protein-like 9 [Hyposoter didymator ichnovirus]